jgi:hypothetical protein
MVVETRQGATYLEVDDLLVLLLQLLLQLRGRIRGLVCSFAFLLGLCGRGVRVPPYRGRCTCDGGKSGLYALHGAGGLSCGAVECPLKHLAVDVKEERGRGEVESAMDSWLTGVWKVRHGELRKSSEMAAPCGPTGVTGTGSTGPRLACVLENIDTSMAGA